MLAKQLVRCKARRREGNVRKKNVALSTIEQQRRSIRCYRTRRVEQNSRNEFEEKETVDRVERWQGTKAEERE